jgi:hypothetical protein
MLKFIILKVKMGLWLEYKHPFMKSIRGTVTALPAGL